MLILKNKNTAKIVFIMLALALTLLTEPVLAKKSRSKSDKSSQSSQKSQKVQKAPAAPKVQRPSNTSRKNSKVADRSQPQKSRTKVSVLRPLRQGSTTRENKPTSSGELSSRDFVLQSGNTFSARKSINDFSSNRKTPEFWSTEEKQTFVSTDNRISSSKTSNIGSTISEKKPFAIAETKSPKADENIRVSPAKTSSIVSTIGKENTYATPVSKQTAISSVKRINTEKSQRIISPIGKQNPATTIVQKPSDKSSDTSIRAGKVRNIVSSTNEKKKSIISVVLPRKNEAGIKQPSAGRSNRTESDRTSRIGKVVGAKKPSVSFSGKQSDDIRPKEGITRKERNDGSDVLKRNKSNNNGTEKMDEGGQKHKSIIRRALDRFSAGSKSKKITSNNPRPPISTKGLSDEFERDITGKHHYRGKMSSPPIFKERSQIVKHTHRHEHVYRDRHDRICHRIIWPKYRFAVYYNWGSCFTFRYVYPYYLRKYVFVSLGGYWPIDYRYIRYYWYGYHPYRWYGYYPIAREIQGDTYNYYTYNYYYNGTAITSETGQIEPVDHTTFADVREKLAQQAAQEPAEATLADSFFDEGVEAFGAGDYETAIEKFASAMALAPDDMILPFACSQALFANEQYSEAAEALRAALAKVSPEKEGVFYPRGLYPDDEVLFEQIDRLEEMTQAYSFDADLQLLLGYHLLGIGEIDGAVEPLLRASGDLENVAPAKVLLELLEEIKAADNEAQDTAQ